MKKFTLISLLALFFSVLTANAELMDKFFYKIANDKTDGWTIQDGGNTQMTPTADYLQVYLAKNAGRMMNRFFNEDGWKKAPALENLPNNTYKFTFDLNMTQTATRSDMEFTLLPINACTASDSRISTHNYHWFNAQDKDPESEVIEDYFFRWRMIAAPTEANGDFTILINENPIDRRLWDDGKDPKLPFDHTTFGFATPEDSANACLTIHSNVKYSFSVDINVVEKTATYTIADNEGNVLKTGVHNYKCEENRAGIFIFSLNGTSTHQFSNMGLSYKAEGPFANDPTVDMLAVVGKERDFYAQFGEGEKLHWILPGETEEAEGSGVNYEDANWTREFEQSDDVKGAYIIECYPEPDGKGSGILTVWTSRIDDDTNVSDDVVIDVVCEDVVLPEPSAAITNVQAGFGKTYKLIADNSEVLLKPTITIHYVIKNAGGGIVTEADGVSGDEITLDEAGAIEMYSWDKTHPEEWYTRSGSVTVNNDVEYVEAVNKDFAWTKEVCDGKVDGYTQYTVVETGNSSHWERIYSDQKYGYKEDGNCEAYDESHADEYVWVKSGFAFFPGTAIGTEDAKWNTQEPNDIATGLLPLVPSEEDYSVYSEHGWLIMPLEGIVYYVVSDGAVKKNPDGAAGYLEMKAEDKYTSDDPAKPNFYIISKRNGYDRPDKGDCNSSDVVVCGEKFWLYRFDTAINNVRVLTYKGFDPETGINNAIVEKVSVKDNAMYNVAGQRINKANGLVIMKGKKFLAR